MQVKGTLLMDYVKIVRANKDRKWDRWLAAEDWEIINGQVLPSNWYPYENFRRIGFAVFKEIADSNLETVRSFGRFSMRRLLEIYKNVLSPGDPVASARNLAKLRRTFMRGEQETRVAEAGPGWLRYEVSTGAEEDHEHSLAFVHQMAGNLEEIAAQTGGKNVTAQVAEEGKVFNILVRWE